MTKLEEVARAIYGAYAGPEPITPWERISARDQEMHRKLARAAVEALREPTEMQAQIARHYFGLNPFERTGPPMNHTLVAAYRAMIDAILSEGE